VLDI
jgi:hypothetical protein